MDTLGDIMDGAAGMQIGCLSNLDRRFTGHHFTQGITAVLNTTFGSISSGILLSPLVAAILRDYTFR